MVPAFPAGESVELRLLDISYPSPAVSMPTFKVMSPAGAAPKVLALI
jgi:hypothetical protein